MEQGLLALAIDSIFVKNILLSLFLGMCSFLAVSKKVGTAIGLGAAVVFVLSITVPINYLIFHFFLEKGALAWTGSEALASLDLSYLSLISFIAVIAAMVQLVEMIVEKFSESLYNNLGIFLPLIAVNCAILGGSLFMVERQYNFPQASVFGFSAGLGWAIAIVFMAAIRERLQYSHIPRPMQGLGITMLITGLMSMTFMLFSGMEV